MRFRMAAAAALLVALPLTMAGGVHAQQWPQKPVRIIVPSNPGGAADVLARRVATQLEENTKQPFVVENRPGAGALIGSTVAVRSAPDGYTLLVHGVGGHVVPSADNPNALDPAKDFTHIAYFGGVPVVFAVHPSVPAKDLKSFIAYTKTVAQGVSWASPGLGTRSHIVGELLKQEAGARLVHIPYKGANQAMTDLMANHVPAAGMTLSSIRSVLDGQKVRPLAVSSTRRLAAFPAIPTFAEAGYPKLTGSSWFGVSGPPGMARPLVERINATFNQALTNPAVSKMFNDRSFETDTMTSAEFTKFFLEEIALLAPYLKGK